MDLNPYESPQSDNSRRVYDSSSHYKLLILSIVLASGFAVVVFGFIYAVNFAGIPYQDPTPAMQASYKSHDFVSRAIILTGLAMFAIGLVGCVGLGIIAIAAKIHAILRLS